MCRHRRAGSHQLRVRTPNFLRVAVVSATQGSQGQTASPNASKGIGAAIAKPLASEGAAVVVNHAASWRDADTVVAEIKDRNE